MRTLVALALAIGLMAPAAALALDDSATLESLQKKINELSRELDEMSTRVDKNERKSALDRINWYGDLRATADTLHYKDVTFNPGFLVNFDQFVPTLGNPANMNAAMNFLAGFGVDVSDPTVVNNIFMMLGSMSGVQPFDPAMLGFEPAQKRTYDLDNDILYTTRLRLGMKAKVWENVDFAGRLIMYKNWGDSTGVKVFDSWNSFTMDGTNSGNTTGDWLRVERAYFDWKDIGGTDFYLSIGRRPSAYGPPTHFRENELRGGTPSGHLVDFNFDGITTGYKLGELTGVEGMVFRLCYGQGFESEWGNGELFNNEPHTDDVHLAGIDYDVINDGTNFLQVILFKAWDVTDGFKGLIAFPNEFAALFAPTLYSDLQKFPNFNFVTRVQPSTNIGDIYLGGLTFSREEMNGINWFLSGGWTRTESNGNAGMFGGLLSDPVFEARVGANDTIVMEAARAADDDTHDGFSVYAGIQIPAPMGKVGLEYNYGSKYWTPFTQAQDDLIGSKLATRGHVGEAYYIFDVNPNMFITVGGKYYDYEYTGSGSPVGEPKDIDDVVDGKEFSMLPAIDTAWDGYAKITVQF